MLDAPCGHGRNARLMTALGFAVVCLDNAEERLEAILDAHHYGLWVPSSFSRLPWASVPGPLTPMRADLLRGSLPFRANSFVGIINVHFTVPDLLGEFERLLIPGGFLFLETVGGQGRNYHQLPAPGELRRLLPRTLRLEEYRERKVGPAGAGAVTVKLFAVKQAR